MNRFQSSGNQQKQNSSPFMHWDQFKYMLKRLLKMLFWGYFCGTAAAIQQSLQWNPYEWNETTMAVWSITSIMAILYLLCHR